MNAVIASEFSNSRFATAAIARLHLDTGQLRWVNAGHPHPLIVRDGALLDPGPCKPHPPLGLQLRKPDVCETQLHAGDRVILYTDGIVEARSPSGESSARNDWPTSSTARAAPGTLRRRPSGV